MNAIIRIILLSLLLSTTAYALDKYWEREDKKMPKRIEELKAYNLKGAEKIKNSELKKTFFSYITSEVSDDYKKRYAYLSKRYKAALSKDFPEIVSADTYEEFAKNHNEIGYINYKQIISCNQLTGMKYRIDTEFECYGEGDHYRLIYGHYFVKEAGQWKYDGFKELKSVIISP